MLASARSARQDMQKHSPKEPEPHRRPRLGVIGLGEAGLRDLIAGLENWRLWHLMGSAELRRRYARSRLGQFWLTLSTGILIGSLGFVWSILFKMPIADLLPYVATSMIIWFMLSDFIGNSTSVFTDSGQYFLNERMSFATAVYAMLYKNVLIFLHNAVILVLVFAVFRHPIGRQFYLAIPGLCLTLIAASWLSYVIAILCTRYRDLRQVVMSLLQIAFYTSPVLWKPDFVPETHRWLIKLNPFATFLAIIRDPLLGNQVPIEIWAIAAGIAFGGLILALPFIGRYHRRVVYWL